MLPGWANKKHSGGEVIELENNQLLVTPDTFNSSGMPPTAQGIVGSEGALRNSPDDPEPQKYEYLIEEILPLGRVSLIVGPSGAGKTTMMLSWAESWLAGEPILGQATRRPLVHTKQHCQSFQESKVCNQPKHFKPGTVLYIAADRGPKDTEETMDRVLKPGSLLLQGKEGGFEWRSVLKHQSEGIEHLLDVAHCRSTVKILVIEGAASLLPGGHVSDNGEVANFLKSLNDCAEKNNTAILLALHSPKTKRGEEYKNPRDRILGAISWGAYSSTVCVLSEDRPDDVKNHDRTLLVLPRNYPPREYHFTMTEQGRLAEIPTPETIRSRSALIEALTPGEWYSRSQLLQIGNELAISPSTLNRHISALFETGKLEKQGDPVNWRNRLYRIPPPAPSADKAREGGVVTNDK